MPDEVRRRRFAVSMRGYRPTNQP
ncbi:DivIVA domain-containing protein [Zestomonas carbonaria]